MIDFKNNQKVLFVFSDPAGAKALLAYAFLNKAIYQSNFYFISDREFDFYKDFNFVIHLFSGKATIFEWIEAISPNILITGTSYPSNLELQFLNECNKRNLETISFVDHWTNFNKRFLLNGQLILPNKLFVIDNKAYRNAISEGIPNDILKICNNPYYEFVKKWRPRKKREEVLFDLKIPYSSRYLLFLPEPILQFGLHEKYGFTEIDVLNKLATIMNLLHFESDFKVVIKLHPNHVKENFEQISFRNFIYSENCQVNDLIYYSEAVIGIFSNALIEAFYMRKKVIRFLTLINNFELDPILHIKYLKPSYSEIEIKNEIVKIYDKIY